MKNNLEYIGERLTIMGCDKEPLQITNSSITSNNQLILILSHQNLVKSMAQKNWIQTNLVLQLQINGRYKLVKFC